MKIRRIEFDRRQEGLCLWGNHGAIRTSGLAILTDFENRVTLRPITAQDDIGECAVVIDPDSLDRLIECLQHVRDEIAAGVA